MDVLIQFVCPGTWMVRPEDVRMTKRNPKMGGGSKTPFHVVFPEMCFLERGWNAAFCDF